MAICPTKMIRGHLVTLQNHRGLKMWSYPGEPAQFGTDGRRIIREQTLGWSSSLISHRDQLYTLMNGIRCRRYRPPTVVEPIQAEIDRLHALGLPALAALVGQLAPPVAPVVADPEGRLFSPGETWLSIELAEMGLSLVTDVGPLLARHCAGDLGDHGRTDLARPTAEDLFCPALIVDPATRAAVAIDRTEGLIVSCYPFGNDRRTGRENQPVTVVIVTVLDHLGALTVMAEAKHNLARVE